jgi:RimJ/RimL family protein N-acetyltransferase
MDAQKYISAMAGAFRSERLVYQALENNDSEKKWFYKLQLEPVGVGQSNNRIFRPYNREGTDKMFESITKSALIAVKIYLPKSPNNNEQHDDKTDSKSKQPSGESAVNPIGFVSLHVEGPRESSHSGMIGIQMFEEYTGKGYGSETINWIVDWAFRFANLHRISIGCFSFNPRAIKLYERLGFVLEGRIRDKMYFNREWHDEIRMGMLEKEWIALRGIEELKS